MTVPLEGFLFVTHRKRSSKSCRCIKRKRHTHAHTHILLNLIALLFIVCFLLHISCCWQYKFRRLIIEGDFLRWSHSSRIGQPYGWWRVARISTWCFMSAVTSTTWIITTRIAGVRWMRLCCCDDVQGRDFHQGERIIRWDAWRIRTCMKVKTAKNIVRVEAIRLRRTNGTFLRYSFRRWSIHGFWQKIISRWRASASWWSWWTNIRCQKNFEGFLQRFNGEERCNTTGKKSSVKKINRSVRSIVTRAIKCNNKWLIVRLDQINRCQ